MYIYIYVVKTFSTLTVCT